MEDKFFRDNGITVIRISNEAIEKIALKEVARILARERGVDIESRIENI